MRGFTLIELVMTIVIVGVLAVTVFPRFFDRLTFDSRSFSDGVIATVRYAQKAAIAKHRFVCVTITSSNVSLKYGTTSACADGSLQIPPGKSSLGVPGGVTVTAASFSFDSLGRPSAPQSILINGGGVAKTITVAAETGYVY